MDCSPPGSSVQGILQARILEWVAIAFSKRTLRLPQIALISHANKVMLKILQDRLQQYVNHELIVFKLFLVKAEEPEIKVSPSAASSKSKRVPEKHLFLLY